MMYQNSKVPQELTENFQWSEGSTWKPRRRLLTPAFHFKILDSFVDVFNQQSRVLISIMGEVCDSFPEKKGEIDVYPMLTRCSLDVICGK